MTTSQNNKIELIDIIATSFYALHRDVVAGLHTYYNLAGGRGSTKSSFVSVEIILGMMRDAQNKKHTNAVAFRRYKDNLHDSVFEQFVWAINILGVSELWKQTVSPLRLTYRKTGQAILFRGADKVKKSKSIKVSKGYIKYLWFEELDEFEGSEKIRSIQQSVVRGGEEFVVFASYNPPRSKRNWVNNDNENTMPNTIKHNSDYLSVPPEWLGKQFILAAEHLKRTKPELYEHEYLGKAVGTGAEVFTNLTNRVITEAEIKAFDHIYRGLDWGYAADPFHYTVCHYDKTRRKLYIFYEIQLVRLSNRKAAELIKKENILRTVITGDSAEPKSLAELQEYGINIKGAKKAPGSVEHGIKWLSEHIEEIIIDFKRCPNTWREFYGYELERDANGNFKDGYPDKDNHSIDSIRYALGDAMHVTEGNKFTPDRSAEALLNWGG